MHTRRTQTGLQMLVQQHLDLLHGQRVGLVTHAAAVLADVCSAVDVLIAAGVHITALFGPEHGLAGTATAGAVVGDARDAQTGLHVWSLYGATHEPTPTMLAAVDVLVFDMQDVGARFYTYLSTLFYTLRAAAKAGVPVLVLDRPNPLGGQTIEGPLIEARYASFVGIVALPIRHGLTLGEAAQYMNATCDPPARLTVIRMEGWQRQLWFDQTGLPWVIPSPAMPHLSTATLYPGMCLLEGTNASLGRGTTLPFEICGAPWIDGPALAKAMNALDLPGVRFRVHQFVPMADRYMGEVCGGVQVHIMDRSILHPVKLGLHLITTLCTLYAQSFAWHVEHLDRLLGSTTVRHAIDSGSGVDTITASWELIRAQFEHERQPYLLYT